MKKALNAIYLPGLGDNQSYFQQLVVKLWRLRGIKGHYIELSWGDGEPFAPKLQEIIVSVDRLAAQDGPVALVSASAGASAAINAYVKRKNKICCVIFIAGKVKNAESISQATFDHNPAFKTSLALLPASLRDITNADKAKILSVRPMHDSTVPVADTKIDGVVERVLPTSGHVFSIAYAITVGFGGIARFIKQKAKF